MKAFTRVKGVLHHYDPYDVHFRTGDLPISFRCRIEYVWGPSRDQQMLGLYMSLPVIPAGHATVSSMLLSVVFLLVSSIWKRQLCVQFEESQTLPYASL